jgi:hypothetical protein
MRQAAARVAGEHLLRHEHGLQRLAVREQARLGQRGAAAGAGDELLEQAAALAGLLVGGPPQRVAGHDEARLRLHHGQQQLDGVIQIVPVQRGHALLVLLPDAAWDFTRTLLWHGGRLVTAPAKSHCKSAPGARGRAANPSNGRKLLTKPRPVPTVRAALTGWGRSSVGRAPQWHCGGQEFESPRLHHLSGARRP